MARVRALAADDNKGMRDILTSMLAVDFDVTQTGGDGGAALAAITQLLPDVAILDISMPVLNGMEVARQMRDKEADVVGVFLAGLLGPGYVSSCRRDWMFGLCS